jgi:hypothetical protein
MVFAPDSLGTSPFPQRLHSLYNSRLERRSRSQENLHIPWSFILPENEASRNSTQTIASCDGSRKGGSLPLANNIIGLISIHCSPLQRISNVFFRGSMGRERYRSSNVLLTSKRRGSEEGTKRYVVYVADICASGEVCSYIPNRDLVRKP